MDKTFGGLTDRLYTMNGLHIHDDWFTHMTIGFKHDDLFYTKRDNGFSSVCIYIVEGSNEKNFFIRRSIN
ncbi:hypothetical protein HanIR_Chr04g0150161 [Helianthus annuus]|nr:hypothetical protein HanIR_Chr04g0150161 [Helianthus annuus]